MGKTKTKFKSNTRKQLPDTFERLSLTPNHFHTFYTTFIGLRFPLDVSEVLDLRYLINHAVDSFIKPPMTPDHRQFRESLDKALDTFGLDTPRHRERLLKTLTMIRELHVAHSLDSRDAEERLRTAMTDNQTAWRRTIRNGLLFVFASTLSVISWYSMPETTWSMQVMSLLCAVFAWKQFHIIPRLERQTFQIRQELNDVLRQRVKSLNWKILIYKLALVLGCKQIKGVQVFRGEHGHEGHGHESHTFH